MLLNLWSRVTFYCGCDIHDKPFPLISLAHGEMPVHSDMVCPRHLPESEENPDGYWEKDVMCPTAISLREAEEVVLALSEHMEKDPLGSTDYKGLAFTTKNGLRVKVAKYSFREIRLLVWREVRS